MFRFLMSMFLILGAAFTLQAQKKSVTRQLDDFNRVAVSGGFEKIIFEAADETAVLIETSGLDPEKINTEVKNNQLLIGMKKGHSGSGRATLTVRYRQMKELNNSGSSDIEIAGVLKGASFTFNSSGSGDFAGKVDLDELAVNLSGSCDVELSGTAGIQKFAISGSGDIQAGALRGRQANVAISGSGDVELNVSGPVKSAVSGSGRVVNNSQR